MRLSAALVDASVPPAADTDAAVSAPSPMASAVDIRLMSLGMGFGPQTGSKGNAVSDCLSVCKTLSDARDAEKPEKVAGDAPAPALLLVLLPSFVMTCRQLNKFMFALVQ